MNILLIAGLALVILMLAWLVWEVVTAPEGYEDEVTGFHYGHKVKP